MPKNLVVLSDEDLQLIERALDRLAGQPLAPSRRPSRPADAELEELEDAQFAQVEALRDKIRAQVGPREEEQHGGPRRAGEVEGDGQAGLFPGQARAPGR